MSFNVDRTILTDVLVAHSKYRGVGPPFRRSGRTWLQGQLEVVDDEGARWGGFLVTILFPLDYPDAPPALFEDQKRIKQEADWHVNNDGSLCLGPEVSELRKYMGRAHLLDWLDRSAMPFLANHLYKERTGRYLNGEYPHGVQGIWEYYLHEWKCSPAEVIRRLEYLSGARKPARQDPCPCGSGIPWSNNHGQGGVWHGVMKKAYGQDLDRLKRVSSECS
ncbi:MAG: hypothetical protein JSS84_04105 [Bacteroidetes bacterium]|nr:hypothetical protein [Bacteroidota bacterium]